MEAADPLSARRGEILMESLDQGHATKWGYFGMTGPLCIGDNSTGIRLTKKPKEESDGEPIRNIGVRTLKKGACPDVYFTFAPPLCSEPGTDPYMDPSKINKRDKVRMLDPEQPFKPTKATGQKTFPGPDLEGNVKAFTSNTLGYCHVPHMDNVKDPKETYAKYKGVLPPHNMKVNPSKKGGAGVLAEGVNFHYENQEGEAKPFPEWKPDYYDTAKELHKKELEEHRSKLPEAPFSSMHYGNKLFHSNIDMYMYDIPTHIPRDPTEPDLKIAEHEAPFKPSNPTQKGALKGTFSWKYDDVDYDFPRWMEDPVPEPAKRKPKVDDDKQAFRVGAQNQGQCNPTRSVVTMMRNMRSERPSAFARPNF